jgi:hypothetical protein
MRRRTVGGLGAYALGTFGLLLVLLVGKLAPYTAAPQHAFPQRTRAWLARRALDVIGAIGWLVDRLPLIDATGHEPPLACDRGNARTA